MKLINSLIVVILLSTFIYAETRGMILNNDKLVVPKDNNISAATENLGKKITQLLIKSKKIKKISKSYLKISVTYRDYFVYKLKSIDLDETLDKDDEEFIHRLLDEINQKNKKIKKIIEREEKAIKKLKIKVDGSASESS